MSEPWQDDPPSRPMLPFPYGPEPTADQRAQAEQERRAAIAEGELAFPSLPHYDPTRGCAKCGHSESRVTYCDAEQSNLTLLTLRQIGHNPALGICCTRCGFIRFEKPLDAEETAWRRGREADHA